jgi:hypothetical protein
LQKAGGKPTYKKAGYDEDDESKVKTTLKQTKTGIDVMVRIDDMRRLPDNKNRKSG